MFRTGAVILLFCIAYSSAAQTLTCPNSVAAGCETFHYHIDAWSPETKTRFELVGANSFSSADACGASRQQRETANADALKFLATAAPRMKTQPNRYGECHCDMTRQQTHPNYLDDARRIVHIRTDQELRNQLMLELFDKGLETNAELALAFGNFPSKFHGSAIWRQWSIPSEGKGKLLRPEQTALRETSITSTASDRSWQNDIKLVDITLDRMTASPAGGGSSSPQNVFIISETSKIKSVALEAARVNDARTATILNACSERMQLLSNLGRLMQDDPKGSQLVRAAERAAVDPGARNSFVSSLFGAPAAAHWEPTDPSGMAFELPPQIASDPVAVLRDGTGRFSIEDQKLALYAFLLKSPLIESDEPWIRSIAESHFRQD